MATRNSKGQFTKGFVPHNKGAKLEDYLDSEKIDKIKQTTFKEGENVGEKGTNWRGGKREHENDVVQIYVSPNKYVRRPKKVYEDHHGEITKGWVIYHLNGKNHDDAIENLIAIPRAILVALNHQRITNTREAITKAINEYLNTQIN